MSVCDKLLGFQDTCIARPRLIPGPAITCQNSTSPVQQNTPVHQTDPTETTGRQSPQAWPKQGQTSGIATHGKPVQADSSTHSTADAGSYNPANEQPKELPQDTCARAHVCPLVPHTCSCNTAVAPEGVLHLHASLASWPRTRNSRNRSSCCQKETDSHHAKL